MSNLFYIVGAYVIAWCTIILYTIYAARRERQAERRLETAVAGTPPSSEEVLS